MTVRGDSRPLCPLLLTLLQPTVTNCPALFRTEAFSWHTGFGMLKLGKFWANWDEFF